MTVVSESPDRLLTSFEVTKLFAVDSKTVTRWAQTGRLPHLRTLGTHRRFRMADLEPHLELVREESVVVRSEDVTGRSPPS